MPLGPSAVGLRACIVNVIPSAIGAVPESWNVKSLTKFSTLTRVFQKALPAWLTPPVVNCKRLSFELTALPFNVIPAIEANPLLKLIEGGVPIV